MPDPHAPFRTSGALLIAFAGLPGVGKSTISRELAHRLEATYLRIDTIEQALRSCGTLSGGVATEGYAVAYQLAADNLALGRIVIADCVNPLEITRSAWRAVANDAGAPIREVEVVCSDEGLHRRRVEGRTTDVAGLTLPDWEDVQQRTYELWRRPRLVLDTALHTVEACVSGVLAALPALEIKS